MACKELDVNPAATLDVVGLALESDKRGVVGESSTCNKVRLDFLTLLTTIRKFALLEEMTRSQTIHAENVHFQHRNHLVMWWRLERLQAYSGCLSILQRALISMALAAKDATGLLNAGFFLTSDQKQMSQKLQHKD